MSANFYDKVAKKFGRYHTEAKYITVFLNGDAEKDFKEKLLGLSSKDKTVLDIGCADGRFTLSIAPYFKKVTAIDISKGMLDSARELQKQKGTQNVDFKYMNAFAMSFPDESFDLIYNRRGPTSYPNFFRLLKSGGYSLEINIGEKDCQEIKEIFGRGQNFGNWNESTLEKNKDKAKEAGFKIIFVKDYFYDQYYASYEDLDLFLQGVPIFEDYDSIKDNKLLKRYVSQFQEKKGIRFPRHRVVIVAKKI